MPSITVSNRDGGPAITVQESSISQYSEIFIFGDKVRSYGQPMASNMVRLTNNFAGSNAPNGPHDGQLWYNTSTNELSVYRNSSWDPLLDAESGSSLVNSANFGDLNDVNFTSAERIPAMNDFVRFNGTEWVAVEPSTVGMDICITDLKDVVSGQNNGDILVWNGNEWAPQPAPTGGGGTINVGSGTSFPAIAASAIDFDENLFNLVDNGSGEVGVSINSAAVVSAAGGGLPSSGAAEGQIYVADNGGNFVPNHTWFNPAATIIRSDSGLFLRFGDVAASGSQSISLAESGGNNILIRNGTEGIDTNYSDIRMIDGVVTANTRAFEAIANDGTINSSILMNGSITTLGYSKPGTNIGNRFFAFDNGVIIVQDEGQGKQKAMRFDQYPGNIGTFNRQAAFNALSSVSTPTTNEVGLFSLNMSQPEDTDPMVNISQSTRFYNTIQMEGINLWAEDRTALDVTDATNFVSHSTVSFQLPGGMGIPNGGDNERVTLDEMTERVTPLDVGFSAAPLVRGLMRFNTDATAGNTRGGTLEVAVSNNDTSWEYIATQSTVPDYAEFFETFDGVALSPGTTVILDPVNDGYIRAAQVGEESQIIGVVRPKNVKSMVMGDYNEWPDKYLIDDYDGRVTQTLQQQDLMVVWKNENGKILKTDKYTWTEGMPPIDETQHDVTVLKSYTIEVPQLNPAYDDTQPYISRRARDEWQVVGILGQIPVTKGQPVHPNWILMKERSATVDLYLVK